MVRKLVLSLVAVLGVCAFALAQNRQISGTVVGSDGSPVAGAAVMVDGANTGATTTANGAFTISAPVNGSLTVSFLGYKTQQVAVNGRTNIKVVLEEDSQAIDDVIVVAFGTAKKEAFTGSASVVKAEDLAKRQTTNVMNALVGSVSGLQMRGATGSPGGGGGSVNIRGISSMYAGTDPLVIVDGAPYPASLSNIAQSDVESVTVLKDAASAALYGARGASGVIIVTTKKATSREAMINVDMKWGVNSRSVNDYDVITDPGKYYEAYYAQLYNKYFYGDGLTAAAAETKANTQLLANLQYDVYSRPAGENLIVNGKLNPNATLGRKTTYNGTDYWMQPDNWTDAAYRNSLRQEYNVSVNGASDRASYFMSIGYLSEDGIVEHSKYERVSARVKADYRAKKWLKVGGNIGYNNSLTDSNSGLGTSSGATNMFAYTSRMAPIYPLYVRTVDASGKVSIATDEYGNKAYDYGVAANGYGVARPYLGTGNPIGSNQYNNYNSRGNQLNATGMADFFLTSFLKANVTSTVIWGQTNVSDFGNMYYGNSGNVGGTIAKSMTTALRTNNIQTLTYYDSFDKHNINATIGHEYYNSKSWGLSASARGLFSPDIQEISAAATKNPDSASSTGEHNVEGYFFKAEYDYNGKYYASASFRRDASAYFAPANRWGNFWSVGAAWIISKEDFMQGSRGWLDMLKLKASVGQQGNDAIGGYAYIDMYTLATSSETSMAASFWRKGNPDISWETTTSYNFGVEFSLWQGRLSGSVDVYTKKAADQLFWISLPESSGTRGIYDNIGDIRNAGIEVTLNGKLIRTKMVDWSVYGNLSHNSTKILSLPAAKIDPVTKGYSEGSTWYQVGKPLYNYYSVCYAGVDDQGQAMFYTDKLDKDGNVIQKKGDKTYDFNSATRYDHGSILPKVFGGFGTTLRVGNFDASVTFDYQIGGKVYDGHYASVIGASEDASGAGVAIHKDWNRAWSPNNTGSSMPRWQYGDSYSAAASDLFLVSASYLNFQSFTVGYTVPSKLLNNKVKIRVYAAGENLGFWSARAGLDPRYSYSGNGIVTMYSPMRTISGGVQFTF